eukprot:CAMPEP_0179112924 /NCGR_PEP_ID=MMETSP0796-20121207/52811_1 /TAXON_ID=73915 /ORGANISM="Pyrodinium bahamense, Strain pbaha01" /LENGTH=104 /DNA_ID=CAMNT_0020811111 /DNA_START=461 /DNA_END=772 /DNA_ORIENTATION=-
MYPILNFMSSAFSPWVELNTVIVCVTASVCGGRIWPVAGCMVSFTYLGTAASRLKFIMGASRELQNRAMMVAEPSASLRQWKTTFNPAFSKATMGVEASCAGAV